MMNKKIKENKAKLLQKDLEEPVVNEPVVVKFKLHKTKDILLFEKFKQETKEKKITLSDSIRRILINYLEDLEQHSVWYSIRDEMFHAMNRALFVRIGAFMNKINSDFYYQDLRMKAINEKLNLILNILTSKPETTINSDTINYPDKEFLAEPEYFSRAWVDLAEQDFVKYNQQKSAFFEQLKTMINEDELKESKDNEKV
ncbi:Mbov_0398 family ICE element protein [Ureaplasma diversum]|uniref:ICEF Integrative Conjugal Element-II n=1 Tax=Ureaplasma diversum NCTC 246 TaxID=1188241 RepID=A0A084EZ36_9BACT|nr:hypothetical protein [Ureaplasma diversum]KEZ23228.1 hypothetical protein UDIV_3920 [Ureaplasma diversum NCTC 246]